MSLYALGRWIWYRPLRNATEEQIVHAARQQSHFLETVRGIRPLKLFQRQDERRSVWLGLLVEQINAGLRTQKLQLFYQQLNGLLFGVENLLVIWLGATMVMDGQFSVGILMAFNAYKSQFDSRVGSLIDKFFELRMLQLQGERLADIVLQAPEVSHGDILPENLREREASIEIQGLRYRYAEQEPWVLDGLDLRIAGGESVAIVGPSGCGKSTLFNVLLGILPPVEGQIRMAGLDLAQLGLDGLRELVGTVLQDDVLFAGSLSDNISFFDPQPDMPWLLQCAQMAAIHDDIQAMPMGYNTLVGDMGTVLSGGQKQRVMLARALYKKPRILFLDEATSHLDVHCEQRVNAAIRALRITCIMVAHRPETIASADRVIVLGQGKVSLDEAPRAWPNARPPRRGAGLMRALAGLLCGLLGLVPGAAAYEPDVFGTAGQVAGQAYYDALAAQRSLAASRQVAELAAQNLEAADAKYRAGAAALSDRLQAQTALSQASLAQVRDEGALSNALGVIALCMGLAPDTPLRLSGELEAQPDTGFVKAIDEMLAEARREHPALLAAQARLKAAAASVEESRAAGRLSLALSANLARSHSDQAMAFNGDTRERDRSIGLQLNIPLFEGFERTYQVRNALARREASEAELADTEQQVSLEVWNNYQSLSVETRSLARTRELVEQSRQSLEVVQGRYRSGVGSMIELLNALTAYASAEDQHIRALGNWQTSRLRLAASLGRLGLQMI